MPRREIFWLVLVFIGFFGTGASAQRYQLDADGNMTRRTKLEEACATALERFCPDATPGQTRSQVICLKPYRTNLQPYCRAAVNKAMK